VGVHSPVPGRTTRRRSPSGSSGQISAPHQQPDLRKEIERRRGRGLADTQPRVPDAHRASTASLRQRNGLLLAENRRLREQVAELNAELAIAYGQRRAESLTTPPPPPAGSAAALPQMQERRGSRSGAAG
jgi:hypothetical protein